MSTNFSAKKLMAGERDVAVSSILAYSLNMVI